MPDNRDFPAKWSDPADAETAWEFEGSHTPDPLTPLSIDYTEAVLGAVALAWGMRPAETRRRLYVHGYVYRSVLPEPDAAAPPDPVVEERKRRHAEAAPRLRETWQRETIPLVSGACHRLQTDDYNAMSLQELAARIGGCMDVAARAWGIIQVTANVMFAASEPLVDFCKEEFGADGESIAAVMMEGFSNESSASDQGLWDLARTVTKLPEEADALDARTTDELFARLARVDGGAQLAAAFRRYLDRYGWRPDVWFELSAPTWQDDPRPALEQVRRYLSVGVEDPRKAAARSAGRRRRMVSRVRSALQGDPEKLDSFDALLAVAQQYVPVREGRALWQQTLDGSMRVPCLALGARLRDVGVLERPDDVFYLRLSEIESAGTAAAAPDLQARVEERRADRERWRRVSPPRLIGAPPAEAEADDEAPSETPSVEEDDRVLRGQAASRGVARSRARVVLTLDGGDKVESGDILVCRTTAPSWTPLFARVAAVVAETGSVLGHCGIVAREFAIPCVVGVTGATERVRDGMLITVDGGAGVVRLDK